MSWLYYLLEANLYLILFYALYYLVLRHETWHQYNRAYLLGSSALAFIIPLVQLGFLKPFTSTELPPQLIPLYSYVAAVKATPIAPPEWNRDDTLLTIYLVIVVCLLIGLAIKITRLLLLSRKGPARDFGKWKIISTNMERGAFSFFNYLFLSADMAASDTVITHELVHIRQKHSWDIIYLEIFKIINWFNPVAYLLQHSMKELHEFIADEAITGSKEQIDTYTDFLVANACGTYEHPLTNNLFNQSLLKKRIMMLHQKRSGNTARLKYLLALPLMGGLLCASTLAFAKDYGWLDIAPRHIIPGKSKSNIIGHVIDPAFSNERLEEIVAQFYKQGYKMEFSRFNKNNEEMLTVSLASLSTSLRAGATFNLGQLKSNRYIIFVGADDVNGKIYVHSDNSSLTMQNKIGPLPLPPPARPVVATTALDKGVLTRTYRTAHSLVSTPVAESGAAALPLIIVNGERYTLKEKIKKGQSLNMTASDSTVEHSPGNLYAREKWGDDAKNGVIELFGKVTIKVTSVKDTTGKIIRKQTDSTIKGEIKSQIDGQIQKSTNKLPPPAIANPVFGAFSVHLAKYTRYPAKELEQRIVGNVIIAVTINNAHKITDVKVTNDARPVFANEVVRAAKLYTDTIYTTPGVYIIGVQYNLVGERMTKSYLPAPLAQIQKESNFAAMVELVSFFKD